MILIDALYINNGGGKILLDYLIQQIQLANIDVFYILDKRIVAMHPQIPTNRVLYMKGNIVQRHFFYLKNKQKFSKIFCFSSLPPTVKMNVTVYTYFQQRIYLEIPKEFPLIDQIMFRLKILIIKLIVKNTDYWIVQSELIKNKLEAQFDHKPNGVLVEPFYPEFSSINTTVTRKVNTFLYVSNATPHKNHKLLIETFCEFYDNHKIGKLILTVNKDYPEILTLIENKLQQKYPIENIGFVDRLTLQKKYLESEFLIFPSLAESFGLGLIEAIDCGCNVIGANLPYTFEICEPSLVFDPTSKESMLSTFEKSLNKNTLKPSTARIKNNINHIISYLK